jgi:signal transduction histidine kinase
MVQKILNEIPKRLEHSAGALLTLVNEGQLQTYAMSEIESSEKINALVGRKIDQFSYPIKKDYNKLHEALFTKDLVESPRLGDYISPPVPKPVAATIQTLLGIHSVIAMPLFSGDQPLGVLMLAFKVERDHLKDKDMEMIWAVGDDVSLAVQRAESYQKLKDANDYLSQLDKMKDEFISMASHELNTPLAAVEGYLSMILDEHMGTIDDKAREYLARAYASSKRLAELILDLLNVSRIEQGRVKMKFIEANMFDLAESVIHELQIKSDSKKLTLKLEGEKSDKFNTWCDPDRIREVIVNLVGNSIKYTEKGGITIKVEEDSGKIAVKVVDTGRGIAQEDMNKLFQKFSQVKREIDEHQGTGLGLYISKNFVELHKGRIWVESTVGKGSTFAFEIPVLKEAPKEVQGAILENVGAPKIEAGNKEAPAIVAESSKVRV